MMQDLETSHLNHHPLPTPAHTHTHTLDHTQSLEQQHHVNIPVWCKLLAPIQLRSEQ
jgi:hypothetical protein